MTFYQLSRLLQKAPGEEKKKKEKGDKDKKKGKPRKIRTIDEDEDGDSEGWETVDRYDWFLIISSSLISPYYEL